MHAYVLISLLSSLAAGMLAGAIWARDPSNRRNRVASLLLACTAFWALCDVLSNSSQDPSVALQFIRWSCLGSMLVGPLALHLLVTLHPMVEARYARFLPWAYGVTGAVAIVAVTTGALWVDVHPVSWGFAGVASIWVGVSWLIIIPLPMAALVDWLRIPDSQVRFGPLLGLAVCIPALAATLTDFVLPISGVDAPRLGSASLVAWGAIALRTVYRFRDPILAPHRFAREILGTLPDGVMLLRADDTIRSANRKIAELAASPASALLGRPIGELLVEAPNSRPTLSDERELRLATSSGEMLPVAVREAPLHDEDGHPLGRVLVVRDLREVVSLRNRLITSGRLAAVGQLAAGIAHEINNPVAYMQSNLNQFNRHWETARSELLKHDFPAEVAEALEEGTEVIAETGTGLSRVAAIVRDVGGFSGTPEMAMEPTDLNALIDTAIRVARPQLRDRVSVNRRYGELPLVPCIASELVQVFLNFLLNAAHAMEKDGNVEIATEVDAEWVRIQVTDDGRGMDAAILEQVFTPFFTTKAVGEGTGLGLSISRQIIEKHSGEIAVTSAPGEGTSFVIALPVAAHSPGGAR